MEKKDVFGIICAETRKFVFPSAPRVHIYTYKRSSSCSIEESQSWRGEKQGVERKRDGKKRTLSRACIARWQIPETHARAGEEGFSFGARASSGGKQCTALCWAGVRCELSILPAGAKQCRDDALTNDRRLIGERDEESVREFSSPQRTSERC